MTGHNTTQPGEAAEPMSPIFETRGGDGQRAAAVFADRTGPLARLAGYLHGRYVAAWWRLSPASLINIVNGCGDIAWGEAIEDLIDGLEDPGAPELTSTAAAVTRIRVLTGIHGLTFIDEGEEIARLLDTGTEWRQGKSNLAGRELDHLIAMGREPAVTATTDSEYEVDMADMAGPQDIDDAI